MRGKRISNDCIAHHIAYKDSFESFGLDDETIVFKKPLKVVQSKIASPPRSPDSIFTSLAPVPPLIHLPKSVAPDITRFEAPSLPLTAVWGNARKLVLAKRSQRQELEDIIDEHLASEALLSKARLAVKVNYLETAAERDIKAMERGLLNKHWIKHRAQKRAARAEHETHMKALSTVDDDQDDRRRSL